VRVSSAYRPQEHLFDEKLAAATPEAAIDLGRTILRERGFAVKGVTLTTVRVSPRAGADAIVTAAGRRPL